MTIVRRASLVMVLWAMAIDPLIGEEVDASVSPESVTSVTSVPANAEVSDGQRFLIDGKGFSIEAPKGWIVQKNLPRSSLYLQAPVVGATYPRNIGVVRFPESVLINTTTAEAFAEKIVKQFPSASSTIENYTLRNHQSIQMADGREGFLFYTDFTDSGQKMMQAHILLSSQTNHYLVTFTDVAEHFENPSDDNQFFNDAWASMTSVQLDSPNPEAAMGIEKVLLWVLGLALVAAAVTLIRRGLAAKMYRQYGNLDQDARVDLTTASDEVSAQPSKTKKPVSTVPASTVVENDDQANDEQAIEEAEMDDGIRSPFAAKILSFRKRQAHVSDDATDGDEDAVYEDSRQPIKKGA